MDGTYTYVRGEAGHTFVEITFLVHGQDGAAEVILVAILRDIHAYVASSCQQVRKLSGACAYRRS